MFSTWDFVRPRHWYPMSTLEQSMMELDYMADRMLSGTRPSPFYYDQPVMPVRRQLSPVLRAPFRLEMDDDEFFRDLPMSMRSRQSQAAATLKQTEQPGQQPDQPAAKKASPSEHAATTANPEAIISEDRSPQQQRAFSSYSFSSSSILDENGQRVVSTRRRYEDSTGRLKAMHEREVGDKKLRTVWSRAHQDDEGKHESVCSSGNAEDFEKLWASTPFGVAQQKSLAGVDQGQAQVQGEEEQAKALQDGASKDDDASMEQP